MLNSFCWRACLLPRVRTPCVGATVRCMLCGCQHAGGSFWRETGGGSSERVGYARRLAHAAGTSAHSCDDQGAESGIGRYPPQQGATTSDGSEQGSRGASQSCRAPPPGKHARQAAVVDVHSSHSGGTQALVGVESSARAGSAALAHQVNPAARLSYLSRCISRRGGLDMEKQTISLAPVQKISLLVYGPLQHPSPRARK